MSLDLPQIISSNGLRIVNYLASFPPHPQKGKNEGKEINYRMTQREDVLRQNFSSRH